ncbi:2TM domain-containing protein [Methyloligella solikamskensis]|uniref:2TM domain-containing protein n=1 Tax=Methyloligella solikamskensis TaxID=1177756 RepID=A0ABW3J5F5_9HYPH
MPKGFPPRGLIIHFAAYCVVIVALAILNIARNPDNLWFLWVLGGWGVGVAAHAFAAYRRCEREQTAATHPR